jgi:hypothetical protein
VQGKCEVLLDAGAKKVGMGNEATARWVLGLLVNSRGVMNSPLAACRRWLGLWTLLAASDRRIDACVFMREADDEIMLVTASESIPARCLKDSPRATDLAGCLVFLDQVHTRGVVGCFMLKDQQSQSGPQISERCFGNGDCGSRTYQRPSDPGLHAHATTGQRPTRAVHLVPRGFSGRGRWS